MCRTRLLVLLVAATVLAPLAQPVQTVSAQHATPEASPAPRFTQTVTVAGRGLGLTCAGSGSPTVVLVGGGSRPAEVVWPAIFDAISPMTRVCAFDRAGL